MEPTWCEKYGSFFVLLGMFWFLQMLIGIVVVVALYSSAMKANKY